VTDELNRMKEYHRLHNELRTCDESRKGYYIEKLLNLYKEQFKNKERVVILTPEERRIVEELAEDLEKIRKEKKKDE
jgi:hypothetical protein